MRMVCKVCGKDLTEKSYCIAEGGVVCTGKCFNKNYWNELLDDYKKNPYKNPVINGVKYSIADENERPGGTKGSGGRHFTIKFKDGTIVETTNLWVNGEVARGYKTKIKNNAKFI